jgi:Rps23 Pro-64 3,4-dihydroxylase Tpa1-like proline 4-hydroxylase
LEFPPTLNPALDRAALAAAFAQKGRSQISNLLTRDSAQRLYAWLKDEVRYGLAVNGASQKEDFTGLTPQQRQDEAKAAWRRVGLNGFQFLYDRHVLSKDGEPYPDAAHFGRAVTDFLNGPEFLGLMRAVTGIEKIAFADAQATLYRPGHFLTVHDDNNPGPNRLVAYVLNLTPAWRPEWGGLLEFIGDDGQVSEGYVPAFNNLRLFRVPARHHVSYVAPFALAGRYSITGWLRAR